MSLREENKIKTRTNILKTAMHLFRANGYEETMINDVADKARVSRQTLYNYFPNKESLLLGIALEEIKDMEKLLSTELKDETDIIRKIRTLLEVYTLDSFAYLSLARRIAGLLIGNNTMQGETQNRIHEMLASMVEEAKSAGVFRENIQTEVAVDVLIGLYYTILFESPETEPISKEECLERITNILDVILAGLCS